MWRKLFISIAVATTLAAAAWSGDVGIMKPQSVSAQSAGCPGDFNNDGMVNLADFLAFAGGFGARSGDANYDSGLDMDGSGSIDLSDFLAFAGVFGTICEDRSDGSVATDRAALVALYNATDGPNWVNNENWLTDAPLGEWHGVTADDGGRVTELSFWSNEMVGRIPPEVGHLGSLRQLVIGYGRFDGGIPRELGNLTRLEFLVLYGCGLSGPIHPELSNLAAMHTLQLTDNALSGPIPAELGRLTNLTTLELSHNNLSGSIPPSFLQLDNLKQFAFGNNDFLCIPGSTAFLDWLKGIENHDAAEDGFCNRVDLTVLKSLYEVAGGTKWNASSGWLGDAAVGEWHGIAADSLGHVVTLDLTSNGMVGRLPVNLGELTRMTVLRIGGNALSDRLPLSLTSVPLRELHYTNTGLCAPADRVFQSWLLAVPSHEGTRVECVPLADREILGALFEATDGTNWERKDNWLTDTPLGDWHGIKVNETGRVVELVLRFNNLTGPIPPEVGDLIELKILDLSGNYLRGEIPRQLGNLTKLLKLEFWWSDLEGEIPPELGNLERLTRMHLGNNQLGGGIPPELGSLTELYYLSLFGNRLTGPIPRELANLTQLDRLWLVSNELSGPIPAELGRLDRLTSLYLGSNGLEGEIPPALGDLKRLETLEVAGNRLSGRLPPELGAMSSLREFLASNNTLSGPVPPEFGDLTLLQVLSLSNNPELTGPLPNSLISLRLAELMAGGTALCVPDEPRFRAWLSSIPKRRLPICGVKAEAYLTQAAQSREYPVPLVAGEGALLRVFVTSTRETAATLPPVRATFFLNGTEAHRVEIPAGSATIPTEVREGELDRSANAEIPSHVIQPGLEMVVEIDPSRTLDPSLGVSWRIPGEGRTAVEVAAMPTLNLTLVPFVWTGDNDRRTADLVEKLHPDHELFWETNHLLPVDALEITKHEPVLTDSNSGFDLIREVDVIRTMEGGTGHWKGLMYTDAAPGGIASNGGKVSFSKPYSATIAHELGHNFNLNHAPCRTTAGLDPAFPQPDGRIGVWGYDPRNGGSLVPPSYSDLMGYCSLKWISDYHFSNALAYRLADEGASATTSAAVQSLLVSGQVEADGGPSLDPAFVVDAPRAVPGAPGPYSLTGHRADGAELFWITFDMPVMADGDGSSSFVFTLPVQPEWTGNLASITLSGPGGVATLDESTDRPMAILRDLQTGQVRGILSDLSAGEAAQAAEGAFAAKPGTEVLFSRGIPNLR